MLGLFWVLNTNLTPVGYFLIGFLVAQCYISRSLFWQCLSPQKIITSGNPLPSFQAEEKGGRGTSVWERNINWLPAARAPTRDPTCNPGICPDWELNPWPFSLWDIAQPTEPHRPGPPFFFKTTNWDQQYSNFFWKRRRKLERANSGASMY